MSGWGLFNLQGPLIMRTSGIPTKKGGLWTEHSFTCSPLAHPAPLCCCLTRAEAGAS